MQRVAGIGGIFFKARDPEALYAWYEKHLGIARHPAEGVLFRCRHEKAQAGGEFEGATVWALFKKDTQYFGPGDAGFMINYRVDDLDALLTLLAAEGVTIDPRRDDSEYGRFAWITDPEGNRIELWQPPPAQAPAPA